MTAIVGIANGVNVWMGADSAYTSNYNQHTAGESKIFIKHTENKIPVLIGCAGSMRVQQIIEHCLKQLPAIGDTQPTIEWASVEFVDAVRKQFKDSGYVATTEKDTVQDGQILVGVLGKLFTVFFDYRVMNCQPQEQAIGSGDDVAHGSLFTTRFLNYQGQTADDTNRGRINIALEAAANVVPSVAAPFTILNI